METNNTPAEQYRLESHSRRSTRLGPQKYQKGLYEAELSRGYHVAPLFSLNMRRHPSIAPSRLVLSESQLANATPHFIRTSSHQTAEEPPPNPK